MESVTLVIQGVVIVVQSVLCIFYGCRTNDKLDDIEARLKNGHMRIIKLERMNDTRYMPPPASAPPYIPPVSNPKSYEPYSI